MFRLLPLALILAACNLPDPSDFEQTDPEPTEPVTDITDPPVAIGFGITHVEPAVGAPRGLELVEIRGGGFKDGARVFFDGSESPDVTVTGPGLIYALTPPHSPGLVTVRVVNKDTTFAELQGGFGYVQDVELAAVIPAEGPTTGGVPVELTGRGFSGAVAVLFEGRQAIDVQVLDDETILAVLPTGTAGTADVHVVAPGGAGRLRNGFTYFAEPEITGLSPLTAAPGGGGTLALAGRGLMPLSEVSVRDASAETLATSTDATQLVVRVPPGDPGPADVTVTTPYGQVVLRGAFTYVDGSEGVTLLNVWPQTGPATGGGEVLLVVSGLRDDSSVAVRFGGAEVLARAVLPSQNLVLIDAPPGVAGSVADVEVTVDGVTSRLENAYGYVRAVEIDEITPDFGHVSGGTTVVLRGAGFDGETVDVFVGALPAESIAIVDDQTIEIVTPPGSNGFADVRVVVDGIEAVLPEAFLYEAGQAQAFTLIPAAGAIAGNTWVVIYGTDLPQFSQVFFGEVAAPYVEWLGPQAVAVRTPRAEDIGEVGVRLSGGGHELWLGQGYTYFDPVARFGGTWGEPVDGSVNVTVLQSGSDDPVSGAVVVLGSENPPRFKGYTDDRGQVTLSGPDLEGRLDVTAAKFGYSASSIVQFDAENATLSLVGGTPQPGGGGGGEEPLLPGKAFGEVAGVGKYLVMPPWPCDELEKSADGRCAVCVTDDDCGAAAPHCTSATNQPRFCASACSADTDCALPGEAATAQQYVCRQAGGAGAGRCIPNPGQAEAWCFPTSSSFTSPRPTLNQDTRIVLPTGDRDFSMANLRLGEIAIYCVAGGARKASQVVGRNGFRAAYTPTGPGAESAELVMHPSVLGLARHEFILPGDLDPTKEQPTEVLVPMDVPLTRAVNVLLGEQPLREEGPHETSVSASIDLGSDGYVPMALRYPSPDVRELAFTGLPATLSGVLYDAEYVFYGGAVSTDLSLLPTSEVLRIGIDGLDDGSYFHFDGAAWKRRKSGYPEDVHDVVALADDDMFAVTGDGAVIHYNGAGWGIQPIASGPSLNGLAVDGLGGIIAVGDSGRIVTWDGLEWDTVSSGVDAPLRDVVALGPGHAIAVGSYVILESAVQAGGPGEPPQIVWSEIPFGPPKDLHAVWGSPASSVWAVGGNGAFLERSGASGNWKAVVVPFFDDLHGVWSDDDGTVVAVGDQGRVLMGTNAGFDYVQTPTRETLRAVWGRTSSEIYAVGDNATVLAFDGGDWTVVTEGQAEVSLRGIHGAPAPNKAIAALGSSAVHLGPFMHVQDFVSPAAVGTWNRQTIRWQRPDKGALPTFNSMRMYGPTGGLVWNIMAPGWLSGFELPDLASIEGLPLVPAGEKTLMAYSVTHPDFDIDSYDSRVFSLLDWRAWVVVRHSFDQSPSTRRSGTVP